jgi:sugar phosphate permease
MFYGWRVVAGAFIAQLFVVGFYTYAASLLVGPVKEAFGVSLEQVMYSLAAATVAGLVVQPVAGVLIDRLPVRWLMAAGALVYGLGLLLLARSTGIVEYIIVFGVALSLANAFAGPMCASAVIARWFTASRGRAMGIAAIGTSVGGIVVPGIISAWLVDGDWRLALEYFGYAVLLVMLPAVVLLVRGQPADLGMEPEPDASGAATLTEPTQVLQLPDILRDPRFWYIGLCLGLLFAAYSAILSNLTPYATNQGLTPEQASTMIMAVAIGGFAGKLLFGMLADKLPKRVGLWLAQGLVVLAFVALATGPGYTLLLVSCVILGLATGGMLPVWGAMMAQVFGIASYGRAMGLMGPVITLCILPSYPVVGRLFDASGSYVSSLYLASAAVVVSALLLLPLRTDPQPVDAAIDDSYGASVGVGGKSDGASA